MRCRAPLHIWLNLRTPGGGLIKTLAIVSVLFVCLAACGPIDSLKEGYAHSQAVSADLEKSFGVKSFVGFNWNNGSLTSVNITFQGIPTNAALAEITAKSTQVVLSKFKQKPKQVIVAFVVQP